MVRVKHEPHYKGSNPKLERIKTILKFSKALEKLILTYQNEELLNSNDNININNDNNINVNNTKRRGRPKINKDTLNINKDNINNKEDNKKENKKEINELINNFDDKVKIDYTGISTLMNNDIELK